MSCNNLGLKSVPVGTIYETINDIYIFFGGDIYEKMSSAVFLAEKEKYAVQQSVGEWSGGFVVKNFPPGEVNLLQKMLWKVCKETGVQPSRSSRVPGCFGGFLKGGWGRRWDRISN